MLMTMLLPMLSLKKDTLVKQIVEEKVNRIKKLDEYEPSTDE